MGFEFLFLIFILIIVAVLVLFWQKKKALVEIKKKEEEEKQKKLNEQKESEKVDSKLEKQKQKELAKQKQREEKRAKNSKSTPQPMEGVEHSVFVGNTSPNYFSFSEDGKYLIVACSNRQNLFFDSTTIETKKNPLHRIKFVDDQVIAIDLIQNNGNYEAVCGLDRGRSIQSFIIDPKTGKFTPGSFNVPNAAKEGINQLKVSKDHAYVSIFCDQTYLSAFHPNGTPIIRNESHQMKNYELSCSSDSYFFALSSYTSEIVVLGIKYAKDGLPQKAQKAFTLSGHKNSMVSIDFHPKLQQVCTGSLDGHFNIYSTPVRWLEGEDFSKQIESYSIKNEEPIKMVRQNPVDDTIAVLTQDEVLYFYRKGNLVKTVERPHSALISQLEWSPDGKYIVALAPSSCYLYAYNNP